MWNQFHCPNCAGRGKIDDHCECCAMRCPSCIRNDEIDSSFNQELERFSDKEIEAAHDWIFKTYNQADEMEHENYLNLLILTVHERAEKQQV